MTPTKIKEIVDWVMLLAVVFLASLNLFFISMTADKNNKIEQYKIKLDQKDSQIYERQLKYEEQKDIADRLGRELADSQERLAKAAERERARSSRASRSRSAGSSRASKPRSSASFSGGLHDITMYCPTGNTTASGKYPRRGMVATIARSIPFGTRVSIEGLGEFVVEDRIGHGSEFDIFSPSCGEARRFGRQHRKVTILDTD